MSDEYSVQSSLSGLLRAKAQAKAMREGTFTPAAEMTFEGKTVDEITEEVKKADTKAKASRYLEEIPPIYKEARLAKDIDHTIASELVNHFFSLVIGKNGRGKTYLGYAFCNSYKMQNPDKSVMLVRTPMLLSEVKSVKGDWVKYAIENYGKLDVLVLDEIDKMNGSESDRQIMDELIDYRWSYKKRTICIGNLTEESAPRLIGQANFSRLTGAKNDGSFVILDGGDRRR